MTEFLVPGPYTRINAGKALPPLDVPFSYNPLPEDAIELGPLYLREWDNFIGHTPNVTFSMFDADSVQGLETSLSTVVMFFHIAKDDLNGRKLYVDYTYGKKSSNNDIRWSIQDKALDRTSAVDFPNDPPDYNFLQNVSAYTELQELIYRSDGGADSVNNFAEFTPAANIAAATSEIVTVAFEFRQAWNTSPTANFSRVNEISLYEADETTLLGQFIPSAVNMEVTGTNNDYGIAT